MRPINDNVICERLPAEDRSEGGILLPDKAKKKTCQAIVKAVGPGRMLDSGTRVPVEVKVGAKVAFEEYSGTTIKIEGKELLVLGEKQILAVLE